MAVQSKTYFEMVRVTSLMSDLQNGHVVFPDVVVRDVPGHLVPLSVSGLEVV